MKSILLFIAFFAIVSARINPAVVYQSFTSKLGLTQEQQAGLAKCGLELRTLATPLFVGGKAAAQSRVLSFFFADDAKHREVITSILEKAQTSLPSCKQYVADVASVFAKSTISNDEKYVSRQALTNYRFNKYSGEIISTLVTLLEEKAYGNSEKVGEHLATIVQLLSGLSHPETMIEYIMNYEKNHNQVVEISVLEPARLIQQTINNAAKELGSNKQITEEQANQYVQALIQMFTTYGNNMMKVRSATSTLEKEVAVIGTVRDLIKGGAVVGESVKGIFQTFVPNYTPMTRNNFKYAAMIFTRNYLKNLPTLTRRSIDLNMEINHHHPAAAGKALAAFIKALLNLH